MLLGYRPQQILLLSAVLLSSSVFGQEVVETGASREATVRSEEELRAALEDDNIFRIDIVANLSLRVYNGWERDRPLQLNRSVLLAGLPDRSVKLSIRDLSLPGPRFDFLKADRPVDITFVR